MLLSDHRAIELRAKRLWLLLAAYQVDFLWQLACGMVKDMLNVLLDLGVSRYGGFGVRALRTLPVWRLAYLAMEVLFLGAVFTGDQEILRKGVDGVSDGPILLIKPVMDQAIILEQLNETMPNNFQRRSV